MGLIFNGLDKNICNNNPISQNNNKKNTIKYTDRICVCFFIFIRKNIIKSTTNNEIKRNIDVRLILDN